MAVWQLAGDRLISESMCDVPWESLIQHLQGQRLWQQKRERVNEIAVITLTSPILCFKNKSVLRANYVLVQDTVLSTLNMLVHFILTTTNQTSPFTNEVTKV